MAEHIYLLERYGVSHSAESEAESRMLCKCFVSDSRFWSSHYRVCLLLLPVSPKAARL